MLRGTGEVAAKSELPAGNQGESIQRRKGGDCKTAQNGGVGCPPPQKKKRDLNTQKGGT